MNTIPPDETPAAPEAPAAATAPSPEPDGSPEPGAVQPVRTAAPSDGGAGMSFVLKGCFGAALIVVIGALLFLGTCLLAIR